MTNRKFYRARDLVGTVKTRQEHDDRGMLAFSPAKLWRMVKNGDFPAPVRISGGITAWPAEAVDRWIADRSKQTEAA